MRVGGCDQSIGSTVSDAKNEFLPLTVGGTAGESNIANLWKDHFSAIANSVGSTDNRDQVMNALWTVPGHNDVLMYMSCGKL